MYWRRTEMGALPAEPAMYGPDHSRLARQECCRRSGSSCRSLREDTPLRLLASREIAAVGGKFTKVHVVRLAR
jgi:hypothetical protein